jgi:hypothetical protein
MASRHQCSNVNRQDTFAAIIDNFDPVFKNTRSGLLDGLFPEWSRAHCKRPPAQTGSMNFSCQSRPPKNAHWRPGWFTISVVNRSISVIVKPPRRQTGRLCGCLGINMNWPSTFARPTAVEFGHLS